jgi:hypothetical protein
MTHPVPTDEEQRAVEDRRNLVRARWRFTLVPLEALVVLLLIFVPPAALRDLNYSSVVPLFLFFGAIVVLFIGSWYDFGAKGYVRGLLRANQPITDADLDIIHREQFILTLCYGGVAGLYILVAVVIAFL